MWTDKAPCACYRPGSCEAETVKKRAQMPKIKLKLHSLVDLSNQFLDLAMVLPANVIFKAPS